MKYYIAAKLDDHKIAHEIEERLIRAGHEITHRWTLEYMEELRTGNTVTNCKELGKRCFDGAKNCDILGLIGGRRGRGIWNGCRIG